MESCGHYRRWREDFALVEDMGIGYLRFGPPIHKTWLGDDKYDWEFADLTFADLKRRNIVPIVDLCHFGVPDWIGNFQNPDFMRRRLRTASRGFNSTPRSTRCISARPFPRAMAGGTNSSVVTGLS
jgi:beta-glucosidase/6-phospho-beta-glucosidase/beta-galactosidase